MKTRRLIRSNNFTQQTNALDVDKHMYVPLLPYSSYNSDWFVNRMAYIEENLKVRSRPKDEEEEEEPAAFDPQEALYNIADRWKVEKQKPTTDVGSVTNSLSMLTAIPEVDLGMEWVIFCLYN